MFPAPRRRSGQKVRRMRRTLLLAVVGAMSTESARRERSEQKPRLLLAVVGAMSAESAAGAFSQ